MALTGLVSFGWYDSQSAYDTWAASSSFQSGKICFVKQSNGSIYIYLNKILASTEMGAIIHAYSSEDDLLNAKAGHFYYRAKNGKPASLQIALADGSSQCFELLATSDYNATDEERAVTGKAVATGIANAISSALQDGGSIATAIANAVADINTVLNADTKLFISAGKGYTKSNGAVIPANDRLLALENKNFLDKDSTNSQTIAGAVTFNGAISANNNVTIASGKILYVNEIRNVGATSAAISISGSEVSLANRDLKAKTVTTTGNITSSGKITGNTLSAGTSTLGALTQNGNATLGTSVVTITAPSGNNAGIVAIDGIFKIGGNEISKTIIEGWITTEVAKVVNSAPEAFDTLGEIAAWIANDETGAAAMANTISSHTSSINTLNTKVGTLEGQYTFGKIVIGETTITAADRVSSLTLVAGANITLTPDATNKKITIASTDTNTLYDLSALASQTNGNVKLRLSASGSSTGNDDVTIKGTGATTVTTNANGVITINSVDNNTTYDLTTGASLTNGNVKLNLTAGGSGSGTDSITIKGTGGTTVTTDANGVIVINTATALKNPNALAFKNGDTSIFSYDGSAAKTLTFKQGANVTITTDTSGNVTIAAKDTTYSVMGAATANAAGSSGLVPAPAAGKQGQFLRGDGTWATPTNTTYNVVSTTAPGLAPVRDGSTTKYLRGDGTWKEPIMKNAGTPTTNANGSVLCIDTTNKILYYWTGSAWAALGAVWG